MPSAVNSINKATPSSLGFGLPAKVSTVVPSRLSFAKALMTGLTFSSFLSQANAQSVVNPGVSNSQKDAAFGRASNFDPGGDGYKLKGGSSCAQLAVAYTTNNNSHWQQMFVSPEDLSASLNQVDAQQVSMTCVMQAMKATTSGYKMCFPATSKAVVSENGHSVVKNLNELKIGDQVAVSLNKDGTYNTSPVTNIAHHQKSANNDIQLVSVSYKDAKGQDQKIAATGNHNINVGYKTKDGIKTLNTSFGQLQKLLKQHKGLYVQGSQKNQWHKVESLASDMTNEVISPITQNGEFIVIQGNTTITDGTRNSAYSTLPDAVAHPLNQAFGKINQAYIYVNPSMKDGLGSTNAGNTVNALAGYLGKALGHIG